MTNPEDTGTPETEPLPPREKRPKRDGVMASEGAASVRDAGRHAKDALGAKLEPMVREHVKPIGDRVTAGMKRHRSRIIWIVLGLAVAMGILGALGLGR